MADDVLFEVTWDSKNQKEVSSMRELFSQMRLNKIGVFHSVKDGLPEDRLTEFKEDLGVMVLLPMPTTWSRIRKESTT